MLATERLLRLLMHGDGGNGPALTFMDAAGVATAYTRSELASRAEALGSRLAGVVPGSKGGTPLVAILASSQELQVLAFLAALSLGWVPALLAPPNRKLERSWYLKNTAGVLRQIRPALVLTDLAAELDEAIAGDGEPVIVGLDPVRRLGGSLGPGNGVRPETAFVQFSSGTTGIKKGVEIPFESVRRQIESYGSAIALQPTRAMNGETVVDGDAVLSWLPLYHDMGLVAAFLLPLALGTQSVMMSPIDWVGSPNEYVVAAERFGSTLGWHPNFAFALMAARPVPAAAGPKALARLRALVNCSEPVTAKAQSAFAARFLDHGLQPGVFTGCYAMAETTFAVTHGTATDVWGLDAVGPTGGRTLRPRLPLVSVGRPLPETEITVRRANGSVAAEREVGELVIRAPFLASGYISSDAGDAFRDGGYHTGDLGYTADGELYVVGRSKDLLIVGGHNVYPEDVERLIGLADGVKPGRVAAFGTFDERRQTERVIAVAEAEPGEALPDIYAIGQEVLAALGVSVAINIVPTGWLIKSSSGKIARGPSAAKWAEETAQ